MAIRQDYASHSVLHSIHQSVININCRISPIQFHSIELQSFQHISNRRKEWHPIDQRSNFKLNYHLNNEKQPKFDFKWFVTLYRKQTKGNKDCVNKLHTKMKQQRVCLKKIGSNHELVKMSWDQISIYFQSNGNCISQFKPKVHGWMDAFLSSSIKFPFLVKSII